MAGVTTGRHETISPQPRNSAETAMRYDLLCLDRRISAMLSQRDTGSAEVSSAAPYRVDLAKLSGNKFVTKPAPTGRSASRVAFAREAFASYAFLAVAFAGVALLCSGLLALVLI
jgi:hypothetical protein